jgi:hypothetical protein
MMQCVIDHDFSYGHPWSSIRQAVRNLLIGATSFDTTLSYSILKAGNTAVDENGSSQTVDFVTPSLRNEEMMAAIKQAVDAVNGLFLSLFSGTYSQRELQIQIVPCTVDAIELDNTISSDLYAAPYLLPSWVGDIRISLSERPNFAYPPSTNYRDVGGDVRLNKDVSWRHTVISEGNVAERPLIMILNTEQNSVDSTTTLMFQCYKNGDLVLTGSPTKVHVYFNFGYETMDVTNEYQFVFYVNGRSVHCENIWNRYDNTRVSNSFVTDLVLGDILLVKLQRVSETKGFTVYTNSFYQINRL